jgi:hypothetical protein
MRIRILLNIKVSHICEQWQRGSAFSLWGGSESGLRIHADPDPQHWRVWCGHLQLQQKSKVFLIYSGSVGGGLWGGGGEGSYL